MAVANHGSDQVHVRNITKGVGSEWGVWGESEPGDGNVSCLIRDNPPPVDLESQLTALSWADEIRDRLDANLAERRLLKTLLPIAQRSEQRLTAVNKSARVDAIDKQIRDNPNPTWTDCNAVPLRVVGE